MCSFSKEGDDLGQWRAYADNARGYAMGFDGHSLEQAFAFPTGMPVAVPMTFPVTYDDALLRQMQHDILSKVFPLTATVREKNFSREAAIRYLRELSVSMSVPILRSALFFKHRAYINEQEYRFLHLFKAGSVPDLKFRGRPHSLIRYREFGWKTAAPKSLKKIVVGPAADPKLALPFVKSCLDAFHPPADQISIERSKIPYRAT